MSDPVSILNGETFSGAVTVQEAGLKGMITLRGDFADAKMAAALKSALGLALPQTRQILTGAKGSVAWMSPDELLVMVAYDQVDTIVAKLEKSLAGLHALVVNVSDARAMFTLTGHGCREVIAKGAPADLSSHGLPVGEIRRSRVGQLAAAFWLSGSETLHVVCFRSVGTHMFLWLSNAAASDTLPGFL